jgi:hypothetical protein
MTATQDQIVHKFLSLDYSEWTATNWGLNRDRKYWDVDEDTYINGIPLIVDLDLEMGYLLEIVERESSIVSYMVIVTGHHGHDSMWYEGEVGTFFEREVSVFEVMLWAVKKIEGLLEGWHLPLTVIEESD